jgi:hypothetical protein
MKNGKLIGVAAVALSVFMAGTAFAGTWSEKKVQDQYGTTYTQKSYQKSAGKLAVSEWINDGGKWYYFGKDGVMETDNISPDGYAVGDNGEWIASIPKLSMPADMETAYKNVVAKAQQNNQAEYASTFDQIRYTVHDLDHDGVPELLVHDGDSEAAFRYVVYTYDGTSAVEQGEFSAGHAADTIESDADGNLYFSAAHMGAYGVSRITYDGSQVEETLISTDMPSDILEDDGQSVNYDKAAAYYKEQLGIVYHLPEANYSDTRLLEIK